MVDKVPMAFPANFRSLGEMSSGPTDLLVLSLFIFSSTERIVIETGLLGDNIEVTLTGVLPSTKAGCCGIGSDLINFSPISEKYAFIICAFSLSIKVKLPSVLWRGPIVLLRAERFVALLIKFQ